jgi:hypothetical protein
MNSIDEILKERGTKYGEFQYHAEVTQAFKKIITQELSKRNKTLLADQQEALDMIVHKIARIINGDPNYHDSWADIAGYAKLVSDRLKIMD